MLENSKNTAIFLIQVPTANSERPPFFLVKHLASHLLQFREPVTKARLTDKVRYSQPTFLQACFQLLTGVALGTIGGLNCEVPL